MKMKQLYTKLLFTLFALLIGYSSFATHIVGGTITYQHLGGSTYRVTLKLYRDCSVGSSASLSRDLSIRPTNVAPLNNRKRYKPCNSAKASVDGWRRTGVGRIRWHNTASQKTKRDGDGDCNGVVFHFGNLDSTNRSAAFVVRTLCSS